MLSSQTYSKLSSTAKFQLCSRWSRASVHRILEILRGVTALDKKSGREWKFDNSRHLKWTLLSHGKVRDALYQSNKAIILKNFS